MNPRQLDPQLHHALPRRLNTLTGHHRTWRRLLVPGSVRLAKLHSMLQAAMGWTDSHLHCFRIGDELFGMQFDEYPDNEIDEKTVTVLRAVRSGKTFGPLQRNGPSTSGLPPA